MNTATSAAAAAASQQAPSSIPAAACAAMDPEAWRRECVEFRAKLRRDTGTNLTAAACEGLLGLQLQLDTTGEEVVSLQSNPGGGSHSFTSQFNLSACSGIGGARRGCITRVKGVVGGA